MGGEHELQAQSARKSLFVQICLQVASPKSHAKLRKTCPDTVSRGPLRGGTAARGYFFAGAAPRDTALRGTASRGHRFARVPHGNYCLQGCRFVGGRNRARLHTFLQEVKKEFLRLGLAAYLKDMLHEIKSLQKWLQVS